MFTGIIKFQGKISKIEQQDSIYLTIECPEIMGQIQVDSSLAHDGVCLTVYKIISKTEYQVQVMPETINKTNLKTKQVGDQVNLETSLKFSDLVDGHLVQGHVDTASPVDFLTNQGEDWTLQVRLPKDLQKFVTYKGSIAINGVSLTVSKIQADYFQVSLINHTLENTNLSELKKDDLVNLEIDLVARYLQKLI